MRPTRRSQRFEPLSEIERAAGSDLGFPEDLEDLYENAPCGYLSLSPDGLIVKVNKTFCRWTDLSPDEILKSRFRNLLYVAGRIYFETHLLPLLRMQGFVNEVALDLALKGQKRLSILVNVAERRDAEGALILIRMTVFNATDRRRYERELLEARAAALAAAEEIRKLNESLETRVAEAVASRMAAEELLRQSQKMEAIGQLTGGIAHDFNNLLAGIVGCIEMLEIRTRQQRLEELPRFFTAAKSAAKRASTLTHRLLAFSRNQRLDPKPTNVNRLIGDMEDLIRRTVGPSVTLEVVGAGGLWPTCIDPNQLENALLNLCINARDAMPTGGQITIETANKWLDGPGAAERDVPPGQYVSVCVTDSGTGMTPEVIERAFDPFFTTKPIGAGTGLGLSMVYGFARQSGGQVRIYSEVGKGTTMCIYLPRYRGEVPEEDINDTGSRLRFSIHGQTVLVVDDEPTVRMLLTEVLHDAGYQVIEAADGPSALKILQTNQPIHLLISDVGLPGGLNGRQVADTARLTRAELKVLFITGYAENAVVAHGHLEHDMHLLTKPFTVEALTTKLEELLPDSDPPRGADVT